MAIDTEEILVGANGTVYVAPTSASAPSGLTALSSPWVDLGAVSDAGAAVSDSKAITDIRVWQSFYPARKIITSRDFTVAFALAQWNTDTLTLAFGGGTVTEDSGGFSTYTPPSPETLDERSLVLDWADGDRDYRLYIPKGLVAETVTTTLARTSNSELPITFAVIGGTGSPWLIMTNDDNVVEDSSSSS